MIDPAEDDVLLTAFLDDELPPTDRQAMSARLASDPGLRARLQALQQGGLHLQSAMSAALGAAPKESMATRFAAARKSRVSRPLAGIWLRAAALAAMAFLAGMAAERFLPRAEAPEREGWRQSVAEYMSLYSAASFPPRDQTTLRSELSVLSKSVGVDLSEPNLSFGSFSPRSGVLLQFEGAPLAQVGYVADGEPAAYCIIRNGEPDAAPAQAKFGRFNVISWAKAGRGFMVVSAAPVDRLDELARSVRDHAIID